MANLQLQVSTSYLIKIGVRSSLCSSATTEHSESTLNKTRSHTASELLLIPDTCQEMSNMKRWLYLKFSSSVLNDVSSSSLSKFSLK